MQKKVILYIAASLDGYIAKPGDDLGFLSLVEKAGEDYGYGEFLKSVDTVIMGRKTYDWVINQVPEFLHDNLETYIITHTPRVRYGNVQFYNGDLQELVDYLKKKEGGNIFIDGGGEIVHELLKHNLIDECILSVIPVLLGGGIRLFNPGFPEQKLTLLGSKSFDSGLIQLHYRINQSAAPGKEESA